MNKKLTLIIVAIISFACEKELDNTDLPYEEKMVIRGVLVDDAYSDSVYVGKILPYRDYGINSGNPTDQIEDSLESYVRDASVTIIVDGLQYPMNYSRNGYYTNPSLSAKAGKTYRLIVSWNGKYAEATTSVPVTPKYDSIVVTKTAVPSMPPMTDYLFTEYIQNINGNVLSVIHEKEFGFSTTRYDKTVFQGRDEIQEKTIVTTRRFPQYANSSVVFRIQSYDKPYYRYYLTFGNGNDDYGASPIPVAWNVSGDAIGMFLGASKEVVLRYHVQ